ncbi:protein CHLOROPLAST J-LIKE DOMAIN 1, chloroplastic isoform X2 [Andrographis paniculata]|uniref:protein CHLOROPLAST J-LIKE DOMAIN 1, chloroplastic isoform X2 n=1 Tax=Andrographis paniculata TaxID=175694 RepID=UPI0021E94C35|nr:protein CHLOROPLAST J-LIKE DOMAIN 1, chloroplastic isoform X2 [Andrographis paniculata]
MALSTIPCHKGPSKFFPNNGFLRATSLPFRPTFLRVSGLHSKSRNTVLCATFSGTGSSGANSDANPYEVLGVNPLEGFDMVKAAYAKKRKDAEKRGDEAAASQLEKAYDKIMMSQLTKRKKGETFGSFRVSKDIKYADKQPIVPWAPRPAKSEAKDIQINMAISAVFEDGEDEGRMMRMGKRLLRSLALVFGCVAFASLGYTAVINVFEFATGFVPIFLYNNQELLVTASSALMLHVLASFYR